MTASWTPQTYKTGRRHKKFWIWLFHYMDCSCVHLWHATLGWNSQDSCIIDSKRSWHVLLFASHARFHKCWNKWPVMSVMFTVIVCCTTVRKRWTARWNMVMNIDRFLQVRNVIFVNEYCAWTTLNECTNTNRLGDCAQNVGTWRNRRRIVGVIRKPAVRCRMSSITPINAKQQRRVRFYWRWWHGEFTIKSSSENLTFQI